MPKLPDRWLDYNNIGKQIPRSRFISMKVPLKKHFLEKLEESKKFSCEDVIEFATEADIKIGLIIDLTYTKKYYDPTFFTKQGIRYRKIFVPGQIIPSISVISEFSDCVNNFLDCNENNSSVIMVHCTHGLNRTGYMICRFLIEEKGFNPEEAIHLFNEARGHDIERKNYIDNLKTLNISARSRRSVCQSDAKLCNEEQSTSRDNITPYRFQQHSVQKNYNRDNYDYQDGEYYNEYQYNYYENYDYYNNACHRSNVGHYNHHANYSDRNDYACQRNGHPNCNNESQSHHAHYYNGYRPAIFRPGYSGKRNTSPYKRNDGNQWER